ncbi:SCO family protein [Ectobacillus antri]|jgi:protein SCO1/2|uniref:SCO family protein n=1 Tax=Ectobacillus antri TaxID=2486280 RepID=A0ABT6H5W4_9BACI|nr:SCO family protein [Ectobacillus antri]MDG4657734.1 SCO family protein [Ectobacillus antri]MDG5754741.1 SCO family protein [Ectobacillus antri]
MKAWRMLTLCVSITAMLIVSGCGGKLENPLNWEIEAFSYSNQDGKTVGLKELKDKVWIADFIFTSCETVCPPMTANMMKLQEMLAKEEINDVTFVSFSVDPEVDKPDVRKDFMKNYDFGKAKWHFLGDYSQQEIQEFAMKNFQTPVSKPKNNSQVIHGTSFYLVDQSGKVVKKYSALNVPYEEIIKDIQTIQ